MNSFYFFALCVAFAVVYGLVLFKLGQRKSRKLLFYIFALFPVILNISLFLFMFKILFTFTLIEIYWWIFLIYGIDRLFWALSLKKSSEEDELIWFFVILYIPIIGWIVYRLTKLR